MKTIDAGQLDLLSRPQAAIAVLVRHDLFSDRAAGTIAETRWYSSPYPVRAVYNGQARDFLDRISSVDAITTGFDHLPDANDFAPFRHSMQLELNTADWVDIGLFEEFQSLNLVGSLIEVSTIAVPISALSLLPADLSSLGEVRTLRFAGEVTEIGDFEDERNSLRLTIETQEPTLSWPIANGPSVDPKDLGKLLPVPIGAARRVPLVNLEVGVQTALASDMDVNSVEFDVTDEAAFPDEPFVALIDNERIIVGSAEEGRFLQVQRGFGGDAIESHRRGALIVHIRGVVVAASAFPGADIQRVFAEASESGELVTIDPSLYTVRRFDQVSVPGREITSIAFTPDQIFEAIRGLAGASVATQPAFAAPDATVSSVFANATSASQTLNDFSGTLTNTSVTFPSGVMTFDKADGERDAGFFSWDDSELPGTLSTPVQRFRFRVFGSTDDVQGTFAAVRSMDFSVRPSKPSVPGALQFFRFGHSVPQGQFAAFDLTSQWFTPEAGTTIGSFSNGAAASTPNPNKPHMGIRLSNLDQSVSLFGSSSAQVTRANTSIEFETVSGGGGTLQQTSEVTLSNPAGARAGLGVRFFGDFGVDVDEVPSVLLPMTADAVNWNPTPADLVLADAGIGLRVTLPATTQEANIVSRLLGPDDLSSSDGIRLNLAVSNQASLQPFAVDIFIGDDTWTLGWFITRPEVPASGTNFLTRVLRFDEPQTVQGTPNLANVKSVVIRVKWFSPLEGWTFEVGQIDKIVLDPLDGPIDLADRVLKDFGTRAETVFLPTVSDAANWTPNPATGLSVTDSGSNVRATITATPQMQNTISRAASPDLSAADGIRARFFVSAGGDLSQSTVFPGALFFQVGGNDWQIRWFRSREEFPTDQFFDMDFDFLRSSSIGGTPDLSAVTFVNITFTWDTPAVNFFFQIGEVRSFVNEPIVPIDAASFTAANVNSSAISLAGDLRDAEPSVPGALAFLGFNGRTNFTADAGATEFVVRAFGPDASLGFPVASRELDEFIDLRATSRSLLEQPTRFTALYAPRLDVGSQSVEAFEGLLIANGTTNDLVADGVLDATIDAAQARVGVREADVLVLPAVADVAVARRVVGYYVAEALRGQALRLSVRVTHRLGYDLEAGDIVSIQPRWAAAVLKMRIVRVAFDPESPMVGLSMEEVE